MAGTSPAMTPEKVVRHDQNALQGPMVATPLQPFGGSQSTQAPIAAVTALVLLPIHGGIALSNFKGLRTARPIGVQYSRFADVGRA